MFKKRDQNISDELLMDEFRTHRQDRAFEQLYQRHFPSLCKFIHWQAGDIERGKDIAQNIFIKIYQRPELFDSSANFKVWLFSVAKNQWKNEVRNDTIRNKHNSKLIFETAVDSNNQENKSKKLLEVMRSIEKLSPAHKEVFVLKYSNNMTIKEIGQICGCSEGTVKSRLFYALKNLKELNGLKTKQI